MSVSAASELTPEIVFPASVEEATALLAAHPGEACILGGGTWLMRAPIRGEDLPPLLVSLAKLDGADAIVERGTGWLIGPLATHAAIARHFAGKPALRALAEAAERSANPGVRRLATIGGNISTTAFAAADLLPALLVLEASVSVADGNGTVRLAIDDFLRERPLAPARIVTAIEVAEGKFASAHARLTMRRAGDYPVAIVSVRSKFSARSCMGDVRVAIGSVEASARRWHELEKALEGQPFDLAGIEAAAKENLAALTPRDGVDAPSWYRVEVLPHLVREAFSNMPKQGATP